MKAIIGLGNPGKEYENTRHNAGFKFVEFIVQKNSLTSVNKFSSLFYELLDKHGEKLILIKPQTFMNDSGKAVQELITFYKLEPENIYIAFDDLDIALGQFKIQKGRYPKVHNGVNDIINRTGRSDFNFIRIGIDDRNHDERNFLAGRDYVLKKFEYDFTATFKEICLKLNYF